MSETESPGTAVITGASSGIGKVYADRLAARGYDLLLVARRADRLQAIQSDLQSRFQIKVEVLIADLASPAGLGKTVERVGNDANITMLVNNAGMGALGQLAETSPQVATTVIAINISALTALTMAVLPNFKKRNAGTIINLGSSSGFAVYAAAPIYGPSKAFVLNFTQILQKQLAETAIRVQLVAPAVTVSEIWDNAGRPMSTFNPALVMTTEDCVDAALAGLDNGEQITIPSVSDDGLFQNLEAASQALFAASLTGTPAPRYGLHKVMA